MRDAQLSSHHSSGRMLEQHIRGRKIVQSSGDAWADLEMQIFQRAQREEEILVPAVAEPLLVWVVSGTANVEERELNGEWHGSRVKAGSFYLTQTDAPYLMRWQASPEAPFEVMHLYLGLDLVARTALSLGLNPARIRMRDLSAAEDELVGNILKLLRDELDATHQANRLFVSGLAESLTVHLLRHYAEASNATGRKAAQLPAWKLRKVLEHMEAHLIDPFDLDQLADLCAMSRFHFSRAFHNTMGETPSAWFILRRMEHAKELLRMTDQKIIDVAASVGYDSPSHFAKIFRTQTHMTPREYRDLQRI